MQLREPSFLVNCFSNAIAPALRQQSLRSWRVGRVVFGKNAEPSKWFRLDSLLQDIAAHQPSDPSIVPGGPAIDPQNSMPDIAGVVAPSSHPDIFQSAPAAT